MGSQPFGRNSSRVKVESDEWTMASESYLMLWRPHGADK